MSIKNIYIIGAGGHGKVIAEIIYKRSKLLKENIEVKGFLDDNFKKNNHNTDVIPVIGTVDEITKLAENPDNAFILAIGDNNTREKLSQKYNVRYYTAIHPSAVIAENVTIGDGTVIMPGAVINPGTVVGRHCIINTHAVVEHDNTISDFVHISPNAALAGGVFIGKNTWIGIGAAVIQGLKIGKNCMIGAGSVVVENVKNNVKAYGNPCREAKS